MENVTSVVTEPVLYVVPNSGPAVYTIPDESPPPYTPPTKAYNFPAEPPGYVTPPEGWKIEGPPTYNEEGRIVLVRLSNISYLEWVNLGWFLCQEFSHFC